MPSSAHRTQVLLSDDIQSQVRVLAKRSKRSMSAMCSELIAYALANGEEYKTLPINTKSAQVQALIEGADLSDVRMQKLLKLLDALD